MGEDTNNIREREAEGDAFGTVDTLLCELDAGGFNTRASDAMRELMQKLHARAQDEGDAAGKLSIELSFAASRSGKTECRASFKVNAPSPKTEPTTFFITGKGRLSTRDPRQLKLAIRDVRRARNGGTVTTEIHGQGED